VCYCDPAAGDNLYLNDASFLPRPGLADETAVSFESQNYRGYYLTRSATFGLGIINNPTDVGAATFKFPEQHPERAKSPAPHDEETDVLRETTLGWTPGAYAASHDVYFGTDFDDVNDASRTDPRDVLASRDQTGNTYDPPGRLEFGQTYYWRVDEVNAPPDATVFKGNVWSFTTEPLYYAVEDITVTASVPTGGGSGGLETIVDGSGLTDGMHGTGDATMWAGGGAAGDPVWLQFDFDRVYKLYGMHIWNYNGLYEFILGFGFKDVTIEYATEPNEWMTLGDYALNRGTSLSTYAGQLIDLDGLAARSIRINANSTQQTGAAQAGLSEIQFLHKPVFAREPQPAAGATDVSPGVVLSWRPGREADSHEVYVSTDSNAVADDGALVDVADQASYDTSPVNLLLGEKYYWKITEVNEAMTPSSWASDIWDFNTPEFLVVDDFESYTDDPGEEIFNAWPDGYNIDTNGSQVGNNDPPYAEEGNIHSGIQSMPFSYANTGAALSSEGTFTVSATGVDWTRAAVQALVLWFRGSLGNNPAQLYVKINGGAPINFPGSTASLAAPVWKPWPIDVTTLGAAAKSVKTLTIGVSGTGSGQLYIDDVRLYRLPPEAAPAPVDPGTANLVAYYPMSDSAADASGNGRDGTPEVGSSFGAGPQGYGRAIVLDGTSGYVDLPIGSLIASLSDATFASWINFADPAAGGWQRVFDFGTGTTNYAFLSARQSGRGTPVTFGILATGGTEVRAVASRGVASGWHHVAVTLDSAAMNIVLYVDGEPVGSNTTTMLPRDLGQTTQNWLGRSQWANDAYYTGSLDEFRIYDRALTAGEIQYLAGDR
jgi:hypothetical protein